MSDRETIMILPKEGKDIKVSSSSECQLVNNTKSIIIVERMRLNQYTIRIIIQGSLRKEKLE